MAKRIYRTMPQDYTVCEHTDCPLAATCLHQQAYSKLIVDRTILNLINPRKCTKDSNCKYFRDSKPVAYACGFTNFQLKMYPQQYKKFKEILTGEFGLRTYYERRCGSRPIPPKEQKIILNALRKVGVTEEWPFDGYEEIINYYD